MTYRNRRLLDLCHGQPCQLQLLGCTGGTSPDAPSVPAHANWLEFGRGFSHKAPDIYCVPCCPSCHHEIDAGTHMTRDEKRDAWTQAWVKWQLIMWQQGMVRVA